MSTLRTRFVAAARSGLLVIAFNEIVEEIELAILSGNAGAYLHRTDSEATALALVARFKSEGVTAKVVSLDSGIHVKVSLATFFNEAKSETVAAPKSDAVAAPKSARVRVIFDRGYIRGEMIFESLVRMKLNPTQNCDSIEFELPHLLNGKEYIFRCHGDRSFNGGYSSPAITAALETAGFKGVCVVLNDTCVFMLP